MCCCKLEYDQRMHLGGGGRGGVERSTACMMTILCSVAVLS